jgi:hypothetical protein
MLVYWYAGIMVCWYTDMLYVGILVYWYAVILAYWYAGILVYSHMIRHLPMTEIAGRVENLFITPRKINGNASVCTLFDYLHNILK